jgi:hypothetical protein
MTETFEAIDVDHRPLAIPETAPPPALFTTMRPAEKLAYAREVATALREMLLQGKIVIDKDGKEKRKPLIVRIPQKDKNGKITGYSEHVEVEGWLTCAMLSGATIAVRWTKRLTDEDEEGYSAFAEVLWNGLVVGAGEGHCDRGEYRWKSAQNYAIKSMAITRAQSKAGRTVFAWIMVLAGFSPTPAEEMPKEGDAPPESTKREPPPTQDHDEDTPENRDRWRKQIAIGCTNRKVSAGWRHETAYAFFQQQSMKETPDEGDPLTAAQLHLLYRVITRLVADRARDEERFDFDEWLDGAVVRWRSEQ